MNIPRSCGIILHITSLPSPYGIGDLGPSAYRFADYLESASVKYWQILPLNYTEEGSSYSPYSGISAFAGNTLLISPELLVEDGLLSKKDVNVKRSFEESIVEYSKVLKFKTALFDHAYSNFKEANAFLRKKFKQFTKTHQDWLENYALYTALKNHFNGKSWDYWPTEIKNRNNEAIEKIKKQLSDSIEKEKFLQFIFFRQWENLQKYCEQKQIKFIGDLPFYVGYDSSDVWSLPQFFKLDDQKKPLLVAGVPPDYFSETGQLWGMPIFDWDNLKRDKYSWWIKRIDHNMKMFGLLRLDHFRAFSAFWEVPADETTAINGSWIKGPGNDFFKLLKKKYDDLPLIAEDLGEIDQPVRDLMSKYNLPGMRVLQFAFGEDMSKTIHIPHHHIPNSIVYTGTHDNNTVVGWFENDLNKEGRKRFFDYIGKKIKTENVDEEMIRLALQSVSQLAVLPLQDLLGLGQDAIMNKPSTVEGNWSWRVTEDLLTEESSSKLKSMIMMYDREAGVVVEKKSTDKGRKVKKMLAVD
jgi:4-alpha-glucanotransferase